MTTEMQKLRQKVARALTSARAARPITGCDFETGLTMRGVQVGSISMLEVVLEWIDEIIAEGKMNIDEMPAGRELDALVAKKVMGWTEIVDIFDGKWQGGIPPTGSMLHNKFVIGLGRKVPIPQYSTDIAAAWDITTQIPNAFFLGRPFVIGKIWDARFENRGDGTWQDEIVVQAVAPTAPLAICRAALKLIESMEERANEDCITPD